MNKAVVKNKPSGYGSSQGGISGPVGYDPLNNKVSSISSTQKLTGMSGGGFIAEIAGSMAGVAGGLAGAYASGGNPYIIAGSSTAAGGSIKSLAEMIGLGHAKGSMKGMGVIPQKFINFVDNLISNKKTLAQIKSAISNFELSPELKSKLSRAVSSLLKNMSGQGHMMKSNITHMKLMKKGHTSKRAMSGSGGVFQPNVSAYGLVKF